MILLSSTGESVVQLIIVLVIFVVVLALTYFTTKWIAGYQKAHSFNTNLEVIETMKLTQNKYVQIIRVGEDQYFCIGVGKDEITMLGEVSKEQLKEIKVDENGTVNPVNDFKKILDNIKGSKKQD